jgi:hypothetical protein
MGTSAGNGKYIETPERMWELFEQYRAKTKTNHRKKMVFVGKNGEEKHEHLEVPLTMEGFENYVADLGVITDISDYLENKQGRYADYVPICSRIRKTIRQDQIEGGMVGQYNASITQRLNGLVDKQANQVFVEEWVDEE